MKKLDHLQHIEDTLDPVSWLKLLASPSSQTSLSVKYDGAPSLVFGFHPDNGRFFVGTKSVFNTKTNPKFNYDFADIEKNHPGESAKNLRKTLRACLEYLIFVTPHGVIYQGDVLFTADEVTPYHRWQCQFTPNVLTYVSDLDVMYDAKVGIAIHTEYDPNHWIAKPNWIAKPLNHFIKGTTDVFVAGVHINSRTCLLEWHELPAPVYIYDEEIAELVKRFRIQHNRDLGTHYHIDAQFVVWLNRRLQKTLDGVKTDKAKKKHREAHEKLLDKIDFGEFVRYWEFQEEVVRLKHKVLDAIEDEFLLPPIKPFVKDKDGTLVPTQHEGYVLSDGVNSVKLVNRRVFSRLNLNTSNY